jgi:hypothetical protein
MAVLKGIDCKVYRNTATYGSPTWALVNPTIEVTVNLENSTFDASNRDSNYRLQLPALTDISVDFRFHKDKDDADFLALETAAQTRANLDLLILDGLQTVATSDGWRVLGFFSSWTESQPLEDAITVDATYVPAAVANAVAVATGTAPPP